MKSCEFLQIKCDYHLKVKTALKEKIQDILIKYCVSQILKISISFNKQYLSENFNINRIS